ncbi:hypothetical protein MMC24_005746 [Lignoscripta atroalba]|nr:hypothetical protein [Lignoscripta atroalba]
MAAPPPEFEISHLDKVLYLFGSPIAHSLAPLLHQTVYDALHLRRSMIPFESISMPDFLALTEDGKFLGAAVTMPHKVNIIQRLDKLTREGADIGACNTIFLEEGRDGKRILCGTNTDCVGIREAFMQNVADGDGVYRGRPGMVVGGGGASRSAVYALKKWLGCGPIYIVNRDDSEVEDVITACRLNGFGDDLIHVKTAAHAGGLAGPGAIVSCVPDFAPRTPGEIAAREVLEVMLAKEHKGAILEMCYHPSPITAIGELSERAGWQVILGTEAMIWQGLEQNRYWTGRKIEEMPVKQVKAVIAAKLTRARL